MDGVEPLAVVGTEEAGLIEVGVWPMVEPGIEVAGPYPALRASIAPSEFEVPEP